MGKYLKYFNKLLRLIISGNLQNILFRLIGLNNFITLILKAVDHRGNQRAKKIFYVLREACLKEM